MHRSAHSAGPHMNTGLLLIPRLNESWEIFLWLWLYETITDQHCWSLLHLQTDPKSWLTTHCFKPNNIRPLMLEDQFHWDQKHAAGGREHKLLKQKCSPHSHTTPVPLILKCAIECCCQLHRLYSVRARYNESVWRSEATAQMGKSWNPGLRKWAYTVVEQWLTTSAMAQLSYMVRNQQLTTWAMAQFSCYYPLQWETNNCSHGTAQLLLSYMVRDQQLTTWAMAQLSCYYPLQWETNNQSHGMAQLLLSYMARDKQLTTWAMAQLSCYYPLQWETNN